MIHKLNVERVIVRLTAAKQPKRLATHLLAFYTPIYMGQTASWVRLTGMWGDASDEVSDIYRKIVGKGGDVKVSSPKDAFVRIKKFGEAMKAKGWIVKEGKDQKGQLTVEVSED